MADPERSELSPSSFDIEEEQELLIGNKEEVVVPQTGNNRKKRGLLLCILSATFAFVIVIANCTVLQPRQVDYALTTAEAFHKAYRQDRPIQQFGLSDEYVQINKEPMEKRIEDMRLLDQIKFGHCDRFEDFLMGDTTTNWVAHSLSGAGVYCSNGENYKRNFCDELPPDRYVCEVEHPTMQHVTVTIERSGQFVGRGGYDWSTIFYLDDVGQLQQRMLTQDTAFVGGMAAPVHANGTIIGYPPLHIHHAHIFPYGDFAERGKMIKGSIADHHDILFQSHGDSECHDDEGGIACLLKVLDPNMVRVVEKAESGISANFEINDVRQKGSDELPYWFEIVLMHTPYVQSKTQRRSTFVGLNSQCIGPGPCTYPMPLDLNTNILWYNYTHGAAGSELSNGFMANFVLHTHQTLMDSAFLILSPDHSAFEAIDSFRQDRDFPVILECLDEGRYELESVKQELLRRALDNGGRVVCEATKPSLVFATDEEGNIHARDKRSQLNCLQGPVPLNVGDVLTVVAFNQIRPNNYTRGSRAFREQNVFSNDYAAYQHSIFRFDLIHDETVEEPSYVPPSYFFYSDAGEPKELEDFPPLDKVIYTGCPASIKYSSRPSWFN